ncbi:hypothetical protein LRAMOSA08155 [Lichtheimia ramosa]|uniref:Epoxide hydrolase N-terminal domain-containing protein n=1 Tax=Lichtheimia ramosa TaxID=688394 RepID=A0A077WG17_9FUNG|nr:hypothetical protein LRAMOSA08155 [Lichtheimia ramosa]
MSIHTFEVPTVSEERWSQLRKKLAEAIYPNELEKDVGWRYGTPSWAIKPVIKAWLDEYDWEVARAEMNRWHHYQTTIEDIAIHFIHEPSKNANAVPLLLLNGWPSTFYEYHKVIEALRDGVTKEGQAFHVVIPSLPGYGFSEAPKQPGCGLAKVSQIMNELMMRLGYNQYCLHGSDWGGVIGKYIAIRHDDHCKGFHTIMPMFMPPTLSIANLMSRPMAVAKYCASMVFGYDSVYGVGKVKTIGNGFADIDTNEDAGYRAIQATRPYTLNYGLSDSPVGLLAWILDKFHHWTYHESGKKDSAILPETISINELLTHVMIYWLTGNMASSTRLYYEVYHDPAFHVIVSTTPVRIPVAVGVFQEEITAVPREWVEATANVQQWSEFEVGGHFPALETSELFINDIQKFGKMLQSKHTFE